MHRKPLDQLSYTEREHFNMEPGSQTLVVSRGSVTFLISAFASTWKVECWCMTIHLGAKPFGFLRTTDQKLIGSPLMYTKAINMTAAVQTVPC